MVLPLYYGITFSFFVVDGGGGHFLRGVRVGLGKRGRVGVGEVSRDG